MHFSSNESVANLLSRVDNSLIFCRGQLNSTTIKKKNGQSAQHREKNLPEEKAQKIFLELAPIERIDVK